MIFGTHAVLGVLYACVLYFCICTCSAQLSMFHMERCLRNMIIVIIIITLPCPWCDRVSSVTGWTGVSMR